MVWFVCAVAALLIAAVIIYRRVMWPSPMRLGEGGTRIACVGDSITYSLGVVGRRKRWSYPALMVRGLGEGYSAVNYGLSDRTLLSTADKPYFREKVGQAAWETDAQIVVFMLGSNDCKRRNWDAERFAAEYEAVIQHYLAGGKRLLLMVPPKIFYKKPGKEGYDDALLRDALSPVVRDLAQKHHVPCIDLYALTKDHPEWFPDKLHPNRAGNAAIADQVVKVIRGWTAA